MEFNLLSDIVYYFKHIMYDVFKLFKSYLELFQIQPQFISNYLISNNTCVGIRLSKCTFFFRLLIK